MSFLQQFCHEIFVAKNDQGKRVYKIQNVQREHKEQTFYFDISLSNIHSVITIKLR